MNAICYENELIHKKIAQKSNVIQDKDISESKLIRDLLSPDLHVIGGHMAIPDTFDFVQTLPKILHIRNTPMYKSLFLKSHC